MQEIFYEESARTQNEKSDSFKYNIAKVVSLISYVLMALWIIFVFNFFEFGKGNLVVNIIIAIIPIVLFFLSGFFIGKIKNKFCVDYDYTLVSGSIRFSKVIKNVKRVPIIKFDCSSIEKIGKITSDTFNKYISMPNVKKSILTSNDSPSDGKDFFYIVVNFFDNKTLYVLECSEHFLVNVLKFTSKMVIEEDYK